MRQGVYAITHLSTGKVYVGASKQITTRWKTHRRKLESGLHENSALQAAYNETEDVEFQMLESCDSTEDLAILEMKWINRLDSLNPSKGFNISTNRTNFASGQPLSAEILATIKRRIEEKGLTQAEIARAIGMERPNVTRMLTGRSGQAPDNWVKLLDLLGLELTVKVKEKE